MGHPGQYMKDEMKTRQHTPGEAFEARQHGCTGDVRHRHHQWQLPSGPGEPDCESARGGERWLRRLSQNQSRNDGRDRGLRARQGHLHHSDRHKRCEQQHHGAADHGVRVQDVVGEVDRRRHTVPAVLEAVQDAQAGLHRVEAAREDDVHVRAVPHHHDGPAPEGDPGLLRLPGRQPARVAVPAAVHPGEHPGLPELGDRRPQPGLGEEGDVVRGAAPARHRRHPRRAEGVGGGRGGRPELAADAAEVAHDGRVGRGADPPGEGEATDQRRRRRRRPDRDHGRRHDRRRAVVRGGGRGAEGPGRVQDLRARDARPAQPGRAPPHRGLGDRRRRRDEHDTARDPEDAVSQDQDDRYQYSAGGGDPAHTQQGIDVVSVQERHAGGLEAGGTVSFRFFFVFLVYVSLPPFTYTITLRAYAGVPFRAPPATKPTQCAGTNTIGASGAGRRNHL